MARGRGTRGKGRQSGGVPGSVTVSGCLSSSLSAFRLRGLCEYPERRVRESVSVAGFRLQYMEESEGRALHVLDEEEQQETAEGTFEDRKSSGFASFSELKFRVWG
eukprot:1624523-Rhodomonas_salina.2